MRVGVEWRVRRGPRRGLGRCETTASLSSPSRGLIRHIAASKVELYLEEENVHVAYLLGFGHKQESTQIIKELV